ncbi:MAG TPA: PEP-CTERM sorting domain-containing protein [Vicinamibacterales bacterium]|nr:PEP-CTERM sorting domain-containing protein [Vicinamibacterales bacterium]
MNAKLIRLGRAAILASTLLVVPATSQANLLVPGGAVVPDLLADPAGTLVASLLTPLTSGGQLIANLRTAVVENAGGTLDFYYQFGNAGGSGTNLDLSLSQSFAAGATFLTDVFYRLENGGLDFFHNTADFAGGDAPTLATRSADGVTVGFGFSGSPFRSELRINPGEVSSILVVRTNATNYAPGLTSLQNGIIATGPSFAPAAVPEPASLLLLGSAFAAAGYVARHRRKKPTTTA